MLSGVIYKVNHGKIKSRERFKKNSFFKKPGTIVKMNNFYKLRSFLQYH